MLLLVHGKVITVVTPLKEHAATIVKSLPPYKKALVAQLSSVNLTLFREDKPVVWFAMAEGQFEIKGIVDRWHMFFHILACSSVCPTAGPCLRHSQVDTYPCK